MDYLLINIGAISIPFLYSFHPKLKFYLNWKPFFQSLLIIAPIFILWDAYFTDIKVWGFTYDYLVGIDILNLPLEEVLFFICIPYACLYTYHCFTIFFSKYDFSKIENIISYSLLTVLLPTVIMNYDKLYTSVTGSLLFLLIAYLKFRVRSRWLGLFYVTYIALLIPFSIVNGLLTGTGYDTPIVWYNNTENLSTRLGTIPVEDIFYGMLLILSITYLYETFKSKRDAQKNTRLSV